MATLKTTLGLAHIRSRNGITLADIAEKTKISMFFLQAIEDEQFSKLPGGVFDRNYIRQYAAAVGIADAKLLERYSRWEAECNPPVEPKRSTARAWLSSLLASVLG
jgi:cytoskeletal protein RodZ